MKTNQKTIAQLLGLAVLVLFFSFPLAAQNAGEAPTDIPFIDRDGDGVNDIAQNGWGLRFLERQEKRQLVWDQLNIEVIRTEEGMMVDTDGDGVGDVALRTYMQSKHDELIDTDGDGTPDTAIKDYLQNPNGQGLGLGNGNADAPRGPMWRGNGQGVHQDEGPQDGTGQGQGQGQGHGYGAGGGNRQ